MIISKENVILDKDMNYFKVGSLINYNEVSLLDIFSLKTSLFPTIKMSKNLKTMCPVIYEKENKKYLKNELKEIKDLNNGDRILIPKLNYKKVMFIKKEYAWLYGKFIINGYFQNKNNCTTLIIPVKRMSNNEEKKISSIKDIEIHNSKNVNFYKFIIIKNMEIIKLFSLKHSYNKSLNDFIINSDPHIYNHFLRSLMEEKDKNNFIKLDNIKLAHELFIHSYSKCNKILKIISQNNYKNKEKSIFITFANQDEYVVVGDNLYNIIIQKRINNNSLGINIENQKGNYRLSDCIICNSIYIKK